MQAPGFCCGFAVLGGVDKVITGSRRIKGLSDHGADEMGSIPR